MSDSPKPPSTAEVLRTIEHDLFDTWGSVSTGMEKGIVKAVFVQAITGPLNLPVPCVTLALDDGSGQFPARRFSVPDCGPSLMHCISEMGKYLHGELVRWHQTNGDLHDYIVTREHTAKLREELRPRIIVPGVAGPGLN